MTPLAVLPPSRHRSSVGVVIGRIAWSLGTAVMALIALAATATLGGQLGEAWRSFPDSIGWGGLALTLGVLAAVGLLLVVVAAVARRAPDGIAVLVMGLAATAVVRMLVIGAVPTPMETDWANYFAIAVRMTQGGEFFDTVPTGWPWLMSLPLGVFGPKPLIAVALNGGLAMINTALLYIIVRPAFGVTAAGVAMVLYAVFPSLALFTVVLGAETAYSTALLLILALATRVTKRATVMAFLVGLTLGASQYIRSTSVALLPLLVVLPWFGGAPVARIVRTAGPLALGCILVLAPVVSHNLSTSGRLSVSTHGQGGWTLLVGLNQGTNGQFNSADEALVGGQRGTVEFDRRAEALALERALADPTGTVGLMVRKFPLLWGPDDHGVYWALSRSERVGGEALATLRLISQIPWAVVTVGALATVIQLRRRRPEIGFLAMGIVSTFAVIHTVWEIQPRYHATVVPVIIVLAAPAVAALVGRVARGQGSTVSNPPLDSSTGATSS